MLEILQIPVLRDNYIYVIHEPKSRETAAIDPAVAEPVLSLLEKKGWKLTHILNTHHHGDHVGGNLELKHQTGCVVVGMERDRDRIPGIDVGIGEGDRITLGDAEAQVIAVPGHTRGHIAFWFAEDDALFCGDTLFGLGCGRIFEGSAKQMWESLEKLKSLPPATRIYCAHEYTQANARFAVTVDPDNQTLRARAASVNEQRRQGLPTIPSPLAEELATNPFLRPESTSIRQKLQMATAENWQVFAEIRRRKDEFRG